VKPIIFVAVQLIVLTWAFLGPVRRNPSPVYKLLWAAALCGIIGFDIWYLADYAYPAGFAW
jgi:hypothetical protein